MFIQLLTLHIHKLSQAIHIKFQKTGLKRINMFLRILAFQILLFAKIYFFNIKQIEKELYLIY
jgi:hypothetical protein